MLTLSRPDAGELRSLVEDAAAQAPTYDAVGATVSGTTPSGFESAAHHRYHSDADWELAKSAMRSWAGHREAGMVVEPRTPPIRVDTDLAFTFPLMGVHVTGVCRIVAVIDEPDAFGFAYGTLPHHPESGEEIFLVSRRPMGVRFEIRSFSRPNAWFTRTAPGIGRRIQASTSERYLDGLTAAASVQS